MAELRARPKPPIRGGAGSVIVISVAGEVGGFLFGFDTAIINGAVDPIRSAFGLSAVGVGIVVAITLCGAALGSFLAGALADRFGRPKTMVVAAVLFLASALGCGLSDGFVDLAWWRLATGLAVGIVTVIGPLYISEIAPANLRGRLASAQQMAIVLGIFAALLADASIAGVLDGADGLRFLGLPAWRWMFLAGALPALGYGVIALLVPESPRYLAARGRLEAASAVLARLQSLPADQADREAGRMAASFGRTGRGRLKDLFGGKAGLLPVVWSGLGVAALQALVGIDVIFYYSTSLWKSVGFDESAAFGLSVFSSVVNVVATVLAILLIDRIGRRRLLLTGSAGMFASLLLMVCGFSAAVQSGTELLLPGANGVLALVGANGFVVSFAISWGPVVWVLLGEMFPNRIRGVALSLAAGVNWAAGVLVNLTFPALREASLAGSYGIYALMALGSWFLVYFRVAETKGRALEEMADGEEGAR